MLTDTLPWARACDTLAAAIRRELDGLAPGGEPRPIAVAPLGVRDELAVSERPAGSSGEPTVTVFLNGRLALVGPFPPLNAEGTACPRCLARRWQLRCPPRRREGLEGSTATAAAGEPPFLTSFVTTMLAGLIAAAGDQEQDVAYPFVFAVDLATGAVARTQLVADPDCPVCGTKRPDTAHAVAIDLGPAPKPAGGFRQRGLDDLDLPVDALANPVCGMISAAAMPMLGLPSTASVNGSFAQRSDTSLYEIFWGGHANTYAASRLIGVLEGMERHAGVAPRGRCVPINASLSELGSSALDPRDCGVYADTFYRPDEPARPFDPDRPIDWVWGYSLRDERPVLVPLVLTYYHYAPRAERFVQACSNGCASGSSLVEAVYFGLSEVIERDAFLLTWYGRRDLPEIDPATSRRPETRTMVDRLRMYGYEARFFDASTSTPMPVVIGAADRMDGGLGTLCFGAGASLDPEAALASALDEIATDALPLRLRTERDLAKLRAMAADFDKVVSLHDHPLLYGVPEMRRHAEFLLERRPARVPIGSLRRPVEPSADLADDVRRCVAALAGAGHDVIVVNQTSPEQRGMGLHTVGVLVPGLVPIDFGWRRQRALHMPRLQAILTGPPNPAPHPFP